MDTAKILDQGEYQIVQLPKGYRFETDEVCISRQGNKLVLTPKSDAEKWARFLEALDEFPSDYMEDRNQPPMQEREFFD